MNGVVLSGIDGSNPLGFLAALGAVRLLGARFLGLRLCWRHETVWRAVLTGLPDISQEEISEMIHDAPAIPVDIASSLLGKNLTVAPKVFADFVQRSVKELQRNDRRAADFAAAFGSEVCPEAKKNRVQHTSFCFITGSGHQDFIETAASLLKLVTREHIRIALFGPWRYENGWSMRWDPADAREYALRWDNPGPEGVRAVWGANRLALEALPLFPTYPKESGLVTTGFREHKPWNEFTWPLWVMPVSCDTVRSLVALRDLQEDNPDRVSLRARGIEEIFRVQRVRIGSGTNFKVSFRPARSV